MYHDAINSLEENASHAVVSLPLMGSCGVLPLTIISTYVSPSLLSLEYLVWILRSLLIM